MIVLDTHVIIWDALKPELVSPAAKGAILKANERDELILCDISLWEIAMLMHKGRLDVSIPYSALIDLILKSNHYKVMAINSHIAEIAVNLPDSINQDPADRLIVATALAVASPLVTIDRNLRKAKEIKTIW